jgi:hypothetical protein
MMKLSLGQGSLTVNHAEWKKKSVLKKYILDGMPELVGIALLYF